MERRKKKSGCLCNVDVFRTCNREIGKTLWLAQQRVEKDDA